MFRRLILRPVGDEEENEVARTLTVTLWILLSAFSLLLLGFLALPELSGRWLRLLVALDAVCISALVLNRRGYTRFASVFLLATLWLVVTGAALTAGGIAAYGALYYLVLVFVSGLLLGQRAAMVTALVCILTALGLVVIEMTGHLLGTAIPHTPLSRWISITILLVIITGLQYLSVRRVRDALKRSRRELDERKLTEEELRRVSQRLQLATSAASIGIWDWDVKNDELVWDDAMYRLYGLRRQDFTGAFDAWAKSLAPEDFDRANDEVQAALRGEQEFAGEFRIVWPDGSVHFTKAASQTFRDEAGRPLRMVGVNYDITERKLAEEALTDAKERSETLINTIDGIVWEADATTFEFTFVSPQAERFLGYPCEQWLTEPTFWKDHIHPDDRDEAVSYCLSRTAEMRAHDFEYRMLAADGHEVWLRDIVTVQVENNAPKTLRGIMVDITERKLAQERIALLQTITIDIAAASDLPSALEVVLRRVCEKTGWALGQAWIPNDEGTALSCCPAWFATAPNLEEFRTSTKDFAFKPGVGLPGSVWALRQPVWMADVTREMNFPRAEFATRCGLKAGLGVPILSGDEVIAVLEFFLRETRDEDERLVGVISGVAAQIDLMVERKRAEEALRESERRLSDTLTNIEMIAVMADINGDITFCNDYLLRLTNWKREEAIGRNWYEMFLPEGEKAKVSGILEEVEPTGDVTIHLENEIKTRSGERRLVKWTNTTLRGLNGEVIGLAALGDDITERKKAEQQLKVSSDQLRALSERLRRAKEEEGIRIARELHDELGSALTSLKWSLMGLDKAYAGDNNSEGHLGARVRIEEMVGLVDATVNTVRRISSELRPGVLDDLGLVSAIEWHAQQFQEQTGMVCRVESLLENIDLNQEQATAVFRIFQEAMTNILRHAQATKVTILIEEEEGEFVLEITDNGRGITESEKLGTRSLGLLGMRERANSIGASIVISGTTGRGTKLIVRLPIKSEAASLSSGEGA